MHGFVIPKNKKTIPYYILTLYICLPQITESVYFVCAGMYHLVNSTKTNKSGRTAQECNSINAN
jgi:hypothetical protein